MNVKKTLLVVGNGRQAYAINEAEVPGLFACAANSELPPPPVEGERFDAIIVMTDNYGGFWMNTLIHDHLKRRGDMIPAGGAP